MRKPVKPRKSPSGRSVGATMVRTFPDLGLHEVLQPRNESKIRKPGYTRHRVARATDRQV
ncbi:hypothetical protein GCM10009558_095990 [Virgisporangium aurantiacum]